MVISRAMLNYQRVYLYIYIHLNLLLSSASVPGLLDATRPRDLLEGLGSGLSVSRAGWGSAAVWEVNSRKNEVEDWLVVTRT